MSASLAASPLGAALAVWPNPARNSATVQLPASPATRAMTLTDAVGRVVRTPLLPAYASQATLDLHGLAPGLYYLRCSTEAGTVGQRLVIQ